MLVKNLHFIQNEYKSPQKPILKIVHCKYKLSSFNLAFILEEASLFKSKNSSNVHQFHLLLHAKVQIKH